MNRRHMMSSLSGLAALAAVQASAVTSSTASHGSTVGIGSLLSVFNPRHYGAVGDGRTLDTNAVNAAINACTQAGGGMVYLSPGDYLCGAIVLRSNVTLYIEAGATLLGSTNVNDFATKQLIASADSERKISAHLISAIGVDHIGICGPGRIDGQGQSYLFPKKYDPIPDDKMWRNQLQWSWDYHERPSPMVALVNCSNIRIEGVRIQNSPAWAVMLYNCNKVVIHGIAIKNPRYGPNSDGIDIVGSQDVMVSDCCIDVGDDAICLKSEDHEGVPCKLSRNICVANCILTGVGNGFKIGTGTQGGFENITFSNSVIYNEDVDLNARIISGIALEVVDGGWIDGVVISGIQMRRVRSPLFIRRGNRSRKQPHQESGLRGVLIQDIHATDAIMTSLIAGIPGMPLEDISLANIHIDTVYPGKKEWVKNPLPEAENAYPEYWISGWLPASGLYCRHINDLHLQDIHFRATANEWRSTVICDDVTRLSLKGLSTSTIEGGVPAVGIIGVKNAWVSGVVAPLGARALLSIQGAQTSDILVTGCDARQATHLAEIDHSVQPNVLRSEFNISNSTT